jgi:hypothetical protein
MITIFLCACFSSEHDWALPCAIDNALSEQPLLQTFLFALLIPFCVIGKAFSLPINSVGQRPTNEQSPVL